MARINEKEKNQSAYRKGLELENKSLKLSLQQLQDSSTSMQQQNISLEREISVLRERTKNDGVLSNVNEILSISFGAGLTYLFEKNYYASSIAFLVGLGIKFLVNLIINIKNSIKKN